MRKLRPNLKKADDLFGKLIRLLYSECRKCGRTDELDVAHILSRDIHQIRWSEENAFLLCREHHRFYTDNPNAWRAFVKEEIGEWAYDNLKHRENKYLYLDYDEIYARLKGRIKDLQV